MYLINFIDLYDFVKGANRGRLCPYLRREC